MDANQTDGNDKGSECPFTPQNSTASMLDDLEEPAFVDMKDAIEVEVDEDSVPMEEDDDDEEVAVSENIPVQPDMSTTKLESHSGPVYSVAAHLDPSTRSLSILSGGGDDKSFLHRIVTGAAPTTLPLAHVHSDTVSCAAFNVNFIGETNTPKLAAVGSYDGAIVLYEFETGNKVKELEGPSDVEWLCFHPKGGSVRATRVGGYKGVLLSRDSHELLVCRFSWLDP